VFRTVFNARIPLNKPPRPPDPLHQGNQARVYRTGFMGVSPFWIDVSLPNPLPPSGMV